MAGGQRTEQSVDAEQGRGQADPVGDVERMDVVSDGRRVGLAVSTYLVLGLGFVFTLFFVGQFTGGDGGFASSILSGTSVSLGFALAILLSPLLAVVLGSVMGRDGGRDAVFDAGIGSALGFVVMFFVTLVVATSLGSGGAVGSGAGPLVGFAVGVGLTGMASALVAASEQRLLASVTGHEFRRPLVFGAGSFLSFGVGTSVAIFLAASLTEGEGEVGILGGAMGNVGAALGLSILLAPVIGVVVGLFGPDAAGENDPVQSAIASGLAGAVGVLSLLVVLYLVVLVFEPSGTSAGEFPFGPLLGFVVGTGLTAAGAGAVAE